MKAGTRNASRQESRRSGLGFNICKLQTSYLANDEVEDLGQRIAANISYELWYSCMFWPIHLIGSRIDQTSQAGDIESRIRTAAISFLCSTQSLYWLEAMTILNALPTARDGLVRIDSLDSVREICGFWSPSLNIFPWLGSVEGRPNETDRIGNLDLRRSMLSRPLDQHASPVSFADLACNRVLTMEGVAARVPGRPDPARSHRPCFSTFAEI